MAHEHSVTPDTPLWLNFSSGSGHPDMGAPFLARSLREKWTSSALLSPMVRPVLPAACPGLPPGLESKEVHGHFSEDHDDYADEFEDDFEEIYGSTQRPAAGHNDGRADRHASSSRNGVDGPARNHAGNFQQQARRSLPGKPQPAGGAQRPDPHPRRSNRGRPRDESERTAPHFGQAEHRHSS